MDVNNTFKLMNFNAQSIRNKKQEFFSFISRENIDVCTVSETYLTDGDVCSHPKYFTYRMDRSDGRRGGGVAIFVKRSVEHELLPCPSTKVIEAISIRIFVANTSIDVIAAYFPGSSENVVIRDFKCDIRVLMSSSRTILSGDLNARHYSWKCSRNNVAGVALRQFVDNNDVLIHFPDSPTHFPHNGNLPSVIDLMISKGISNQIDTEVDHSFTSDHVPVLYLVDLDVRRESNQMKTVKDYSKANWAKFRDSVNTGVQLIPLRDENVTSDEIDEAIERFTEYILKADYEAIPRKAVTIGEHRLTNEVKALIGLRKARIRRFRRTNDSTIKPEIQMLTKRIEFLLKRQANERFEKVVQTLNSNPGPYKEKFWRLTKFLKNKPKQIPNLKLADRRLITNAEKSEALASHISELQNETDSSLGSDSLSRAIKSSLFSVRNEQIDPATVPSVSSGEIKPLILSLKNSKAPGMDSIENRHLKHLPASAVEFLAKIFTLCLLLGHFPNKWKVAKIRCICKPGKTPSAVDSYRPISLLSCISKLFERILKSRLNVFLEDNEVIGVHQYGFRPGRSCTHQLLRMKKLIRSQLTSKRTTGMLSIDLKAAFESLWHDALIHKLKLLDFPLYMIKMIQSFLNGRKFLVTVGNYLSAERLVESGAPQGAVLSPDLFTIYLHDIPTNFDATLVQFADDTSVLAFSHKTSAVVNKLQSASNSLCRYFKKWRIRTNDLKSEAMLFTRKTAERHAPGNHLRVGLGEIPWKQTSKQLGLTFDSKLKFKEHIEVALLKGERLIRSLYPLIHRRSKLSLQNKVLLYKTIFRPTVLYAAPIWMDCAATHLKRIQVFQNKVLKIILNKPMRTPTFEVHEQTNVEMVNDYLLKVNESFTRNCRNNINPDINLLVQ